MRTRIILFITIAVAMLSFIACGTGSNNPVTSDARDEWTAYGRNGGGTRYFDGDITPANVARLAPVWTYHTGDVSFVTEQEGKSALETTPIFVDGTLYLTTAFDRIIALDPLTGTERWQFDPKLARDSDYSEVTSRGVATWLDGAATKNAPCRRRIIVGTLDARLIEVDARDGKPCAGFGLAGVVDLTTGLEIARLGEYQVTSPPAVIGDTIVVGSSIADNGRVDLPSGVVRAFDARSGRQLWSWDPIPHGSAKRDTMAWKGQAPIRTGAANAWSVLSVDEARGLVFVPTGSPSPDYWGGTRLGTNAHANSVVALHGSDGSVAWSFQVVHHDLWDYDVASQPMLIRVPIDGREVDAVAVGTKMGLLYVLDRDSGKPLFPVEERAVPQSDVAGEESSPTQPFPTWPPPFNQQGLSASEAWGLTDADRDACRDAISALRSEGTFTPPSIRGTVVLPGILGGMNWSGMSYDEKTHVLLANTNNLPIAVRLIPRDSYDQARKGATGQRLGAEFNTMRGTPYGMYREILASPSGMPCNAPPWGKLTAIDFSKKSVAWSVPLGSIPKAAKVPHYERLGSINLGGSMITGGLVFVAAGMDQQLRAFDETTGTIVWHSELPASAQAAPMTYRTAGRQFVVIAAGGHGKLHTKRGDSIVAYALQ